MRVFADTNVFVYAVDDADELKRGRARHLIDAHWSQMVISTQVMVEFQAACSRKIGIDAASIADSMRDLSELVVLSTDARSVLAAAELAERTGLSIYDALIAEAAVRGGCDMLLTEDGELLAADLGIETKDPFA